MGFFSFFIFALFVAVSFYNMDLLTKLNNEIKYIRNFLDKEKKK